MVLNINKNENKATIEIIGRLDTVTAPSLDKMISEELEGIDTLTLDMNALEYISSAGLRVLLGAQKKMQKIGSMKLVGVSEAVMEVFEMTGFADILAIEKQ
jgi:anti-sigma B factor antagonist